MARLLIADVRPLFRKVLRNAVQRVIPKPCLSG